MSKNQPKRTPEQRAAKRPEGTIRLHKTSPKRACVLKIIGRGNPDGSHVDKHQVLERLDYESTDIALGFQLRYLECSGLIVRAGYRSRSYQSEKTGAMINIPVVTYALTHLGRHCISFSG